MTDYNLPTCPIKVTRLPKLGTTIKLSSNDKSLSEQEKNALIEFLGVETIEELTARIVFRPWAKDGVQVEGEAVASLHTQCPISLDRVQQNITTLFNAKFVPPTSRLAKPNLNDEGELVLEMDSDDTPDIFEGEHLDAWAIALEYVILEIDFFARVPDVAFVSESSTDGPDEVKTSPFAVLQSLKK